VLAALRAGKHVYCDRPLAADIAETVRLAAAAAESERALVVGLQARATIVPGPTDREWVSPSCVACPTA
jgi:hypothetical protein